MKKKLLIAIIAIVLAVAIPVTLFVVFGNKTKKKNEKVDYSAQYIAIESNALHDVVNTLLSIELNPSVPMKAAEVANVDITISDNIFALLGAEGTTFADLGLPNTLTANLACIQDGLVQDITANLSLGSQAITSIKVISDPLSGVYYMAIPTISNYYLKASNDMPFDANAIIDGLTEISEILPSLKNTLNKYIDVALAQMKKVDMGTETITVNGKSETATVYTNYITEKVAMNIVKAVLTEAKTDSDLNALLPAGTNLETTIDFLLASLPEDPSNDKDEAIVLKLYLDGNNNVIGRYFSVPDEVEFYYFVSSDHTAAKVSFVSGSNGFTFEINENSAVLYAIDQNVSIQLGSLVFSGDEKNGSVKLSLAKTVTNTYDDIEVTFKWATANNKTTCTLSFKSGTAEADLGHLIISGDINKGSVELTLSDALENLIFDSSNINPSIMLDWDNSDPTVDGRLVLSLMDSPIITFKVYGFEEKTPTDIVFPSGALDVTNDYALQTYLDSIDLSTLRQNLLDANLPTQLIDAIFGSVDEPIE